MAEYDLATTWVLEAPVERVWSALSDYEHWHDWFPALRQVATVEPGEPDGTGRVLLATVRSALPYDLTFRMQVLRVEAPRLLELTALGDLDGTGRWTLAEEEGTTTSRFEWRVATTRPWMNAVAPVARPVLAWNHDVAMSAAGRGLARYLGVPLRANQSGPVEPSSPAATAAAVGTLAVLVGVAVAVARRRTFRG